MQHTGPWDDKKVPSASLELADEKGQPAAAAAAKQGRSDKQQQQEEDDENYSSEDHKNRVLLQRFDDVTCMMGREGAAEATAEALNSRSEISGMQWVRAVRQARKRVKTAAGRSSGRTGKRSGGPSSSDRRF